jgi:dCMP deaminase
MRNIGHEGMSRRDKEADFASQVEMRAALSWDEYFILIALCTSLRSKDPRSKVGAVIVDQDNHIIGTGYNGFVRGADESKFSWNYEGEWLKTKYPYVVHAEQNAVLNATSNNLRDCILYTTLFPCNECARIVAQKQIREVVFVFDRLRDPDSREAALTIFEASRIRCRQMNLPPFQDLVESVIGRLTQSILP